jgi:hypothetical protein
MRFCPNRTVFKTTVLDVLHMSFGELECIITALFFERLIDLADPWKFESLYMTCLLAKALIRNSELMSHLGRSTILLKIHWEIRNIRNSMRWFKMLGLMGGNPSGIGYWRSNAPRTIHDADKHARPFIFGPDPFFAPNISGFKFSLSWFTFANQFPISYYRCYLLLWQFL